MIRLPTFLLALLFAPLILSSPLTPTTPTSTSTTPNNPATPAKLQPRQDPPQGSQRLGRRRHKKAEPLAKKDYSSFLCPGGAVACPVYTGGDITESSVRTLEGSLASLADWFKVGFECMELEVELNSCGGCLALGSGQDCSVISNARATGCEMGSCKVYSCFDGYVVSPDRKTCMKKGTGTPATPITAVTDQAVLQS